MWEQEKRRANEAQARARKLQAKARAEARDQKFSAIEAENSRLSLKLECILTEKRRQKRLKLHKRRSLAAKAARKTQRQIALDRVNEENHRILDRLESCKSEYDFEKQRKRMEQREHEIVSNRLKSKSLVAQQDYENENKHREKRAEQVHRSPKVLARRPRKLLQLAQHRKKTGMYIEPTSRLRIHQLGKDINGQRCVLSFYESSGESRHLELEVYNQRTCRTAKLFVNVHEIIGALGEEKGGMLLEANRRVELCEALAAKIHSFTVDGEVKIILASHLSFQGRSGALLAEKRAMLSQLGQVAVSNSGRGLRLRSSPLLPQSDQIIHAVGNLRVKAYLHGQPFPDFSTVQSVTGVVGRQSLRDLTEVDSNPPKRENILNPDQYQVPVAEDADNDPTDSADENTCLYLPTLDLFLFVRIRDTSVSLLLGEQGASEDLLVDCTSHVSPMVCCQLSLELVRQQPLLHHDILATLVEQDLSRVVDQK